MKTGVITCGSFGELFEAAEHVQNSPNSVAVFQDDFAGEMQDWHHEQRNIRRRANHNLGMPPYACGLYRAPLFIDNSSTAEADLRIMPDRFSSLALHLLRLSFPDLHADNLGVDTVEFVSGQAVGIAHIDGSVAESALTMHVTSVGEGVAYFCEPPRMTRGGEEVNHLAPNQQNAHQFKTLAIQDLGPVYAEVPITPGTIIVASVIGCAATQRLPLMHQIDTTTSLRKSMSFRPAPFRH